MKNTDVIKETNKKDENEKMYENEGERRLKNTNMKEEKEES